MSSFHVHYNNPAANFPVGICVTLGAAHHLAMWLGALDREAAAGLSPELHELRVLLDAKLVKDPASCVAAKQLSDETEKGCPRS